MKINLPHIPVRMKKPREKGITMMMDKGLSVRETEDFVSANAEFTDLVKFGFGTGLITPNVKEKIKIYKDANIKPYFGGTLFEAFFVRGKLDEYKKFLEQYGVEVTEISDGSMRMSHEKKCETIRKISKDFTVLSEVGSKDDSIFISPAKWISMMKDELDAGAWKVIAEARESGNVGIYRKSGSAHSVLINKILSKISEEKIMWEAPIKSQQVWFIKLLGQHVNLGNIAYNEIIPLETIRLGLRGDTFYQFLPQDIKDKVF